VQAPRRMALQRVLREWLEAVPVPANVRVVVDIDPYSFV
jgi:primosomal protein N' (replication factor Y)